MSTDPNMKAEKKLVLISGFDLTKDLQHGLPHPNQLLVHPSTSLQQHFNSHFSDSPPSPIIVAPMLLTLPILVCSSRLQQQKASAATTWTLSLPPLIA